MRNVSDSLDLVGDDHRIVFADLFLPQGLVIEVAIVRLVISVLTTIEAATTAIEARKTDPFLAHLTAVEFLCWRCARLAAQIGRAHV